MWSFELTLLGIVSLAVATASIAIKVVGMPDQIMRNYRSKSTAGVSFSFYVLSFVTYVLWFFYGVLKHDWVIIIAQGALGCAVTGIILWQFFLYGKSR